MGAEERKRRSVHEASHAVVASYCGRAVSQVSIRNQPNGEVGFCQLAQAGDAEQDLLVAVAGAVGESLLDGERIDYAVGDMQIAFRLAQEIGRDQGASLLVGRAAMIAESVLRDRWNAVNRLADALLQSGTLNGAAVSRIIHRAAASPLPAPPVGQERQGVGSGSR